MDMALAILNYSSINKGVNKKEGVILRYFQVCYVECATTYYVGFFI